jgi:hypothetical protein
MLALSGHQSLFSFQKPGALYRLIITNHRFVFKQKVVNPLIKGVEFWQKAFEDPKFAESFAKSIQKEHEKVIKGLMTDPEYQKLLIEVFQDPKMQKTLQTSMKSQEFRTYLQNVIMEILSSPLYKAKIQETLLKAAEETGQQGGWKLKIPCQ